MMAKRVSGSATVVVVPKTRMCVVRASSRPPPNAGAARAEMVGMGRFWIEVRVPRREVRKLVVLWWRSVLERRCRNGHYIAYSSCVNVALSFKSAPAQKLVSTSLARIRALVGPVCPSLCMLVICWLSSESSCLEIALRAAGRFKERIRILPECGAG